MFGDRIATICLEFYDALPKTGKPNANEWTVLSCILLENAENLEVVALGTGSKCIGTTKMSKTGDILNDSHGEVMCKRAFQKFLIDQLLHNKNNNSIFEFHEDSQKFSMREGLKFHFFTTHVPCGDAAIFPKPTNYSEDVGEILDKNEIPAKRMKYEDTYRTGAKCLDASEQKDPKLEGTNYHIVGLVRTKPGRGDPTLSVSCSDKLAKWCHLGLQGCLLSSILETPTYLDSLTIAGHTPFSLEALKRALYRRLGDVKLKKPFHCKEMTITQSHLKFVYEKTNEKSPSASSIIWYKSVNYKKPEVAVDGKRQGVTKKNYNTPKSRLSICKSILFDNFHEIIRRHNINLADGLNYSETKLISKNYQENWRILKKAFNAWPEKNPNLLTFNCDKLKRKD